VRLIDIVETSRDTLASMHDLYLTSVSNRLNSVMKVLTIISTLFIPLSFVTGIFGMNFRHMTVLEKGWGYPAALGLMAAMAAAMLAFFKRKGWF
jgi:magnesium transporter